MVGECWKCQEGDKREGEERNQNILYTCMKLSNHKFSFKIDSV